MGMRLTLLASLGFLAMVFSTVIAHGETGPKGNISFSVPANFDHEGRKQPCLADSLKPGLSVVLVGQTGTCGAKTGGTFTYEYTTNFKATHLMMSKKCSLHWAEEGPTERIPIAVVGVGPAAVRVVPPKDDKAPIPKLIELKARLLAKSPNSDPCHPRPSSGIHKAIAGAPPRVIRTKDATLLIFQCVDPHAVENGDAALYDGPPVLYMNNDVFRLCGACSDSSLFFTVNNRLYLTYSATGSCCGCGDSHFFVYDLSGKTPNEVYWNSNFSD